MFNQANTDTYTQWTKVTNPTINTSNNRFTENQDGGAIDYDYDESGNLEIDAENKKFVYDAENRIKEFFRPTNQTQTLDATYEYDGDGKRVRKIADGVETIFVYNASGQLVAEYSTQMPEEPKASYLTADHLGSARIITDGLGAVVSRHDYMAFGDEVTQTVGNVGGRSSAQGYGEDDEIRKGYTGYEKDTESGLEFAQARYYNSMHGRFTSVDPLTASASIRNPQTFNRYSYVLNSPYKFTDPLGLIPETSNAPWCSMCFSGWDDYDEEQRIREQQQEETDEGIATPTPDSDKEGQEGSQQEAKPPSSPNEQNNEGSNDRALKKLFDAIDKEFGNGAIIIYKGKRFKITGENSVLIRVLKEMVLTFFEAGEFQDNAEKNFFFGLETEEEVKKVFNQESELFASFAVSQDGMQKAQFSAKEIDTGGNLKNNETVLQYPEGYLRQRVKDYYKKGFLAGVEKYYEKKILAD